MWQLQRLKKKLKGPYRSAKHHHGLWLWRQNLELVLPSQCEGGLEAKPLAINGFRVS
jgi:hypothetical protein